MLIRFALAALAGLALVIGLSFIAVGWPSSSDSTRSPAVQGSDQLLLPSAGFGRPIDFDVWLEGPPNSPFPEEGDTAVREMKTIGLHCLVVEQLPLFDDFMMFSPEGDVYVKGLVEQRAFQIRSQLNADASRDERGIAVWRDEWSPLWPDEAWCLDQLDRGRSSETGAP